MSNYYTCNTESANVNLKKVDTIIVYGNTWLGNTMHNTVVLIEFSKQISNSFAKIAND